MSFLHAYFQIGFRGGTGLKPPMPTLIR